MLAGKDKRGLPACSRTRRSEEPARQRRRALWPWPLVGLASLVWFLVRVIPKPSRATYPCQRVAMPLASSFLAWLLGLVGFFVAFRKARRRLRESRYVLAALCLVVALIAAVWALVYTPARSVSAAFAPSEGPNNPMGVAKGIHPGRVVWVRDPNATDWDGSTGYYWEDSHIEQAAVDHMMSRAVRWLAGERTDAAAWDALFRSFNQARGKGNVGYQAGEKVTIKINLNNCGGYTSRNNRVDTSPQVLRALLRHLVYQAGVPASAITAYDSVRSVTDKMWVPCHDEFPDVRFVDESGWYGRIQATKAWNAPVHYAGSIPTDYVPQCVYEADYLINAAALKKHTLAAVTLCAKNHFGSLCETPSPLHDSVDTRKWGMAAYTALVELMGHEHLDAKCLLFVIDGLYGAPGQSSTPARWSYSPFNGDWPSSLLVSQDGVAVDSVGLDFLRGQWSLYDGADNYLHEASQANNPPSGTFYDPEGDGTRLASLGVHEHWNNSTDKQYTRNLGTGNGIELIPLSNDPPLVDAGPDQTIRLGTVANLDGTVTGGGLPDTPGAVTTLWTNQSGPGTVTFFDGAAVDTTATFSEVGTYVVRLTAYDGQLQDSDDATITVEANRPPVALDDTATVAEDSTSDIINVLDNDSDPDGDDLTITDVSDPPHGTSAISGDHVDYSPDPGYLGTDSFDYTIDDGNGGTDTATVTVTVRDAQSVGHTLWAWGQNVFGQLGDGGADLSESPIQVSGLTDVRAAAAGKHHSVAATSDGTPWAWGLNSDGQLGDGTTDIHRTPGQVSSLDSVRSVTAGFIHSAALRTDGSVWAWGANQVGQLGDGTTTARHIPVQVAGLAGLRAIAAGVAHTVAVDHDGTVWAWGYNAVGQLGDGTTTDRATPVQVAGLIGVRAAAVGFAHTLALRRDGSVWAWGQDSHGQLGAGAAGDQHTPIRVPGVTRAIAVAARGNSSAALLTDGAVLAWGDNAEGQLGDGTTATRSTPAPVAGLNDVQAIGVGRYHMAALRSDGTVWTWGANSLGQLGDGTGTDHHTPVQVSFLTRVVAIAAGHEHNLAIEGLAGQTLLTLAAIGNGTVGATPDRRIHTAGTTVTLTPQAAPGWRFHHWEGDLSGSDDPAALLMDSHKSVTAVFAEVVELPLAEGWNLVSLPVEPVDPDPDAVFPPVVALAVWQYNNPGGYVVPAEVHAKKGYWVLASAPTTLEVLGTRPPDTSVAVNEGWNLVGAVSSTPGVPQPVPSDPPAAAVWVYNNPGGYQIPAACAEKRGIWVLATEAAALW